MTEEAQPTSPHDPWPESLRRRHETRDASVRGLIIFSVWFIGVSAVLLLLLWMLVKHLAGETRVVDAPLSAVGTEGNMPPGAPPMQPRPEHDVLPRQDLADMRRREDAVFTQLGWTTDAKTHRWNVPPAVLKAVTNRPKSDSPGATTVPSTKPAVTPIPGVDRGARRMGVSPMPPEMCNEHCMGETSMRRGREAGDADQ